jgi:hypothetical protein
MIRSSSLFAAGTCVVLTACGAATSTQTAPAAPPKPAPVVDTYRASIPNVQQIVDSYAKVQLKVDLSKFSERERQMLLELIRAADVMDSLYWKQVFGDPAPMLEALHDDAVKTLFKYNYGPWERLNGDQPFITGFGVKPKGAGFYPTDLKPDELATLTEAERTDAYSMVRRDTTGKLISVPYNVAYATELGIAAQHLRQAAALSDDAALADYLKQRAQALLANEYRASDMAWMDMKSNQFDAVIGPVENYDDKLNGSRTSFEGYVLIKDTEWSARLARFAKLLPALQRGLPVPAAYKREVPGTASDLNAYDVLLYAGYANTGAKTIAINLPNDEVVQLEKGTRRLQLKNVIQAKFDRILLPIATDLIATNQLANIRFDAFFDNLMFHEVAHGLGIKNTLAGSGTVRAALKEQYGALEEAKADILGLYLVSRLLAMGEIKGTTAADHYVTFVAGILRSVRFGVADAHGKANMIEFNYFEKNGAFKRDAATGRYSVNVDKARAATSALAARILKIQGDGDYDQAARVVNDEGTVGKDLESDLMRLSARSIPVDVVFEQGAKVLGLE